MARKLRGTAIQSGTISITQLSTTVVNNITTGGGPKVTSITYPNSATAAVNTGNQSIVLTGTGFESNVQVYVNGSEMAYVSSEAFKVPANKNFSIPLKAKVPVLDIFDNTDLGGLIGSLVTKKIKVQYKGVILYKVFGFSHTYNIDKIEEVKLK